MRKKVKLFEEFGEDVQMNSSGSCASIITPFDCVDCNINYEKRKKDEILKDASANNILAIHLSEFGPSAGAPEYKFMARDVNNLKDWLMKWQFVVEDEVFEERLTYEDPC